MCASVSYFGIRDDCATIIAGNFVEEM